MTKDREEPELDVAAWLKQERDSRKPKPPAPPALVDVLGFLQDELASLIERLASFAQEPAISERDVEGARRLGSRLRRLAGILHEQDADSWLSAARNIPARRAWKGWKQTCLEISRREDAVEQARLAGDRLEEAGRALQLMTETEGTASAAKLARDAAGELLRASTHWNATQRWKQSLYDPPDWFKNRE